MQSQLAVESKKNDSSWPGLLTPTLARSIMKGQHWDGCPLSSLLLAEYILRFMNNSPALNGSSQGVTIRLSRGYREKKDCLLVQCSEFQLAVKCSRTAGGKDSYEPYHSCALSASASQTHGWSTVHGTVIAGMFCRNNMAKSCGINASGGTMLQCAIICGTVLELKFIEL